MNILEISHADMCRTPIVPPALNNYQLLVVPLAVTTHDILLNNQSLAYGVQNDLGGVMQVQFLHEIRPMGLDGGEAHIQ